ncbi:MAG TPA: MarR family transcriptional regulator [Solirubrobacteraceae bacterium]|nr:MarR family transcriptional regulator [Solirubrobacteraceae bacterium]
MSSRKRELFDQLIDEVRGSQSATARFDQAVGDALGLNRTDLRCLDEIQRRGTVSAGALADATGLTTGAMTAALDRLERSGYARRVPDPADRRRVLVELTDRAADISTRFYAEHIAQSRRLFDRYTEREIELLLAFVREAREFNEAQAARLEGERRG